MHRSVNLSLKFLTLKKKKKLLEVINAYRWAVNYYINYVWKNGGTLDAITLSALKLTCLTERYKSNALRYALSLISSVKTQARKANTTPTKPIFNGFPNLDAKFIKIEENKSCKLFDLILKISILGGKPIHVPLKKTVTFNKWINFPGSKLLKTVLIQENKIQFNFEINNEFKKDGKTLGIDIGLNKMIVDSDGNQYGTEFKKIIQELRRKEKGSIIRKKLCVKRRNYINTTVNSLPWDLIKVLGIEELKDLKKGKSKNRSKKFRTAIAPWVYSQILRRIKEKAEENRVLVVSVPPAYTSQTCPICGMVSKLNRKGEKFKCIACGHTADADHVGSLNVLTRTLQILQEYRVPEAA
jgi:IS605 OrfB family transposase